MAPPACLSRIDCVRSVVDYECQIFQLSVTHTQTWHRAYVCARSHIYIDAHICVNVHGIYIYRHTHTHVRLRLCLSKWAHGCSCCMSFTCLLLCLVVCLFGCLYACLFVLLACLFRCYLCLASDGIRLQRSTRWYAHSEIVLCSTHSHTCIFFISTYLHTYIHTCANTNTYTYTYTSNTYIHTYVHTNVHMYIHTCMHTYSLTYLNKLCIYIYI